MIARSAIAGGGLGWGKTLAADNSLLGMRDEVRAGIHLL